MDYSLRTFSIYRCCNYVNIFWQPFNLRRQVQFHLDERGPFIYNEDRKIQKQTTAQGSYIYVDPGEKLHYIKL